MLFLYPKILKGGGEKLKVEIRSDNTVEISGYVNVVERQSKPIRNFNGKTFRETVRAGTFQKAIDKGQPIELRLNHNKILCDTQSGLDLYEDNVGLHARAVTDDEETVRAAKEGKLTGWSFGFTVNKDSWSDSGEERVLEDINLDEVSILTLEPAYIATSVEVRGNDTVFEKRSYTGFETVNNKAKKPDKSVDFMRQKLQIEKLKGE